MYIVKLLLGIWLLFSAGFLQAEERLGKLMFGYTAPKHAPPMCPKNPEKGFTTDIVRSIFERLGYSVDAVIFVSLFDYQ